MTAYVVVHIEVTDPQAYPAYAGKTAASAAPFGGEFLAKGGKQIVWEGEVKPRTVIIAFPDLERAQAWHDSPEYQAIMPLGTETSVRDFMVVEGV
jgi:uncharacterized protein (DUF1330 family)